MPQVARKAGIGRISPDKALYPKGNLEFATVLKVVKALGLRLHATPSLRIRSSFCATIDWQHVFSAPCIYKLTDQSV